MSRAIAKPDVAALGEIHYGRRRIQPPRQVVQQFQDRAAEVLKYPRLRFDAEQVAIIGKAFGQTIAEQHYTCYSCAIMPDHAHLLIRKHKHQAEDMIDILQRESRLELYRSEAVEIDHPVWTEGGWKGFKDDPAAVWGTLRYIDANPGKENSPAQGWPFVVPYDNWPFHKKLKRPVPRRR